MAHAHMELCLHVTIMYDILHLIGVHTASAGSPSPAGLYAHTSTPYSTERSMGLVVYCMFDAGTLITAL